MLQVSCSFLLKEYHYVSTKKDNDMSNLHSCYTKILGLLHTIETDDNFLEQIRLPRLTDKQLIALNLAAEAMGIDSERYLFKHLPESLTALIDRTVYNRRRRRLTYKIEQLRTKISAQVHPTDSHYIIDSMPLEVCRFSRAKRSKVCQDSPEVSPDYGYCAAQKMTYFGYKLHAVCSTQGVLQAIDITAASTHDIHYLEDVREQFENCVLIGDKGYLSRGIQQDLFETSAIRLTTPMRTNQENFKPFHPVLRKARKRIETIYSQLCDQFLIRRNYAKSFQGLAVRVLSKITAFTMIQWINKLDGNHINNIKIVPA